MTKLLRMATSRTVAQNLAQDCRKNDRLLAFVKQIEQDAIQNADNVVVLISASERLHRLRRAR